MADTTTLYYENGVAVPYDSLSEETKLIINQAWQAYEQTKKEESDPGFLPFLIVMMFMVALAWVLVRKAWQEKGVTILGTWSNRYSGVADSELTAERNHALSDYFVYEGRDIILADEQYDKIIGKHSSFYRHLSPGLKEIFIRRTKKFLSEKTFLIKSNSPFVEMPVLLSASAVQLTFGLQQFLLPHYQYIRVYPEEYFAKGTLKVLAGHVYGNTITVSWNHFLKGYEQHDDGVNLGLHEMAHALYFQLVEADTGRCGRFTRSFNQIMAEGAEVYELKHQRPSELFTENAYRNLQEFWAESVELFFERPAELRRAHTDLYEQMKEILKQDPVNELYPVLES